MYQPNPKHLDDVPLPQELVALTEQSAENVHEVWAASRVAQGWTSGPLRDDEKKQTPCLVPYADLPEEEKAYDRNTAMQTLKLIVALGYDIRKK